MTDYLFIGGPLDGQFRAVANPHPWITVPVPHCQPVRWEPIDIPLGPSFPTVEYKRNMLATHEYGIRFYAMAGLKSDSVFERILKAVYEHRHLFERIDLERS